MASSCRPLWSRDAAIPEYEKPYPLLLARVSMPVLGPDEPIDTEARLPT